MITYDFGHDSSPSIWSAVNSDDGRGEIEVSARRLVRFESDSSFQTTFGANDGTIVGLYEVAVVAITRHVSWFFFI